MRLLVSGLLLMTTGAWAADTAQALRFSSGSPELQALAQQWVGRGDDLLQALASTEIGERRGAAVLIGELGAKCAISPSSLVAGVIGCPDVEAKRWAGRALLGRLAEVTPARLLDIGDPSLALRLLANHPEAKVLDDPAVVARLRTWLNETDHCEGVAALIVQRGSLATWGRPLVDTIAAATKQRESGSVALQASHHALCLLTRTQRGLASYAGHYDLLVADWNDALAASAPKSAAVDPVVADAVGRLPDRTALVALLRAGPSALPAIEQAMAGADKSRRRELEPVARLMARAVSPELYAKLGDAGLAGIDADRPRDRLIALAAVAATVQEISDPAGILHLMTWVDDADADVRVAALDRLVRLSDNKKSFKRAWHLSDEGLFPPAHCRWRLRRCLTRGQADEQVSALQLVAGMKATDLAEEVAGLLLSPSSIVVETAIETLGHFDGSGHQTSLLRVVSDRRQPTPRRITVLEMIAKNASGSSVSQVTRQQWIDQIERLGTDGDDVAMRGPALKTQFVLVQVDARRQAILKELLGDQGLQRAGLELLYHTASDPWRYRIGSKSPPLYVSQVLPFLFDGRDEFAALAANALVQRLDDDDHRANVLALFPAGSREREQLIQWCARTDRAWGGHLALAIALDLVSHDAAIVSLRSMPAGEMRHAWVELLERNDDPVLILRDMTSLQPVDGSLADTVAYNGLRALLERCVRSPRLLPTVLASTAIDLLGSNPKTDYGGSHGDRGMTKTFSIGDGSTLVVKGVQRSSANTSSYSFDEESMVWSVVGAAPTKPDDQALDEVLRLLGTLRVGKDYETNRALLISLLSNSPPDASVKVDLNRDGDLWRLITTQHPTQRSRIIAAFATADDGSGYRIVKFLLHGDPDMLAVAMAQVKAADDEYEVRRFMPYLSSLTSDLVEPHLGTLLASAGGGSDEVKKLVKKIGRLPFTAAISALAQGRTIEGRVMPYGDSDLPALNAALAALDPAVVLSGIAGLRLLRDAAPAVFDQVMREQAARQDASGAAWLRMGLPLQAGMRALYDQALQATQPDVWLVGAAIALKDKRLDAAGFLERVGTLPAESLKDASLVAKRYLDGKLAGHEPALVALLRRAPGSALAAWVPLLPAHESLAVALRDRVGESLVADQVGYSLAVRMSADATAWTPLVRIIVPAAGGRLDYLLPRE